MLELENEIINFANELIKSNYNMLKINQIVIKVYPRISFESEQYREFIFVMWNEIKKSILIIEFPTFIDKKPFCTITEAKEWIHKDFEDFINKI